MLNFARNQLIIPEKWGFEPGGEYAKPTFKLTNRRKRRRLVCYVHRRCHREQTVHDFSCSRIVHRHTSQCSRFCRIEILQKSLKLS